MPPTSVSVLLYLLLGTQSLLQVQALPQPQRRSDDVATHVARGLVSHDAPLVAVTEGELQLERRAPFDQLDPGSFGHQIFAAPLPSQPLSHPALDHLWSPPPSTSAAYAEANQLAEDIRAAIHTMKATNPEDKDKHAQADIYNKKLESSLLNHRLDDELPRLQSLYTEMIGVPPTHPHLQSLHPPFDHRPASPDADKLVADIRAAIHTMKAAKDEDKHAHADIYKKQLTDSLSNPGLDELPRLQSLYTEIELVQGIHGVITSIMNITTDHRSVSALKGELTKAIGMDDRKKALHDLKKLKIGAQSSLLIRKYRLESNSNHRRAAPPSLP